MRRPRLTMADNLHDCAYPRLSDAGRVIVTPCCCHTTRLSPPLRKEGGRVVRTQGFPVLVPSPLTLDRPSSRGFRVLQAGKPTCTSSK